MLNLFVFSTCTVNKTKGGNTKNFVLNILGKTNIKWQTST